MIIGFPFIIMKIYNEKPVIFHPKNHRLIILKTKPLSCERIVSFPSASCIRIHDARQPSGKFRRHDSHDRTAVLRTHLP